MNCWEYKKCAEEVFKTCPAYPDSGSGCWMLEGVKCQGGKNEFSSLDEQVGCCSRCDFYAHENGIACSAWASAGQDQEAAGL